MRSLPILLAGLLTASSAPLATPVIRSTPVPLDRGVPARVRLGGLRFVAGWELTSGDPRFGDLAERVCCYFPGYDAPLADVTTLARALGAAR